jgi:hypothetical protein
MMKSDKLKKRMKYFLLGSHLLCKKLLNSKGQSIASVLVGLSLGAFVLLGLTQVFVQFQKVKVADTRESDLRGLLQLAGLALSPTGPAGPAPNFRNSCDETFVGATVMNTAGALSFSSPSALRLNLGFGAGSELIAPAPAANSRFGTWTLVALDYLPEACRLLANPSNPSNPCLPTSNEAVIVFGNVRLRLSALNPLTGNSETRDEFFPVRIASGTPTTAGQFPISGCRGSSGAPSTPVSLTLREDLCQALCFVGTGSPQTDCFTALPAPGSCNFNRQICDALGAPGATPNGPCGFSNFRRNALSVTGNPCQTFAPIHGATGFLLDNTSAVSNFECAPLDGSPTSCPSCWIKHSNNGATTVPVTTACPGASDSKWFLTNPAGTGLNGASQCGFPLGRICPKSFSGCGITAPTP